METNVQIQLATEAGAVNRAGYENRTWLQEYKYHLGMEKEFKIILEDTDGVLYTYSLENITKVRFVKTFFKNESVTKQKILKTINMQTIKKIHPNS